LSAENTNEATRVLQGMWVITAWVYMAPTPTPNARDKSDSQENASAPHDVATTPKARDKLKSDVAVNCFVDRQPKGNKADQGQ
jgi:hypothetical protein